MLILDFQFLFSLYPVTCLMLDFASQGSLFIAKVLAFLKMYVYAEDQVTNNMLNIALKGNIISYGGTLK